MVIQLYDHRDAVAPPASLPSHLAPHMSITHRTYLLKLSGPHVGEGGQALCSWTLWWQPEYGHFVLPACGWGQNGGCQTNHFVLLP